MAENHAPDLPALPRDTVGAPVFGAPWEAQAFAMAVRLHEAGHFAWTEWAERLAGDELRRRTLEWDAAARATPHGKPIELRSRGVES